MPVGLIDSDGLPQGPGDIDEVIEIEQLCLKHPAVLAEIEKLKLPSGVTVLNDPWIYGCDDENETRRLFQCYMYMAETNHAQANHYSLPLPFSPVFDCLTHELVRMDYLPTGTDHSTTETSPWKPVKAVEYAHDLLNEPLRTDLKPYVVQQPEGASFSVNGNAVHWQKWDFRIGFNYRDGLVLYGVTYDKRSVFYRLSVCEMTVPYGGMSKIKIINKNNKKITPAIKLLPLLISRLSRPSSSIPPQTSIRCR